MPASDLRPETWDAYVGQSRLKIQLDTYCTDALAERQPLPHMLFAAETGMGKTSLAALLADRVADPFHVLPMPMTPAAVARFFSRWQGGMVLFDEFHRLPTRDQEDYLSVLEDGYLATPNGRRIPIPWFTAILATTEPQLITAAVRRRCPLTPSWDPYTDEELGRIVQGMAEQLGFTIPSALAEGLGRAAGGAPGAAHALVYNTRALAKQDKHTLAEILTFCEIDPDGLTKDHRRLLAAIDRLAGTGTVGMDRLADYTGMHVSIVRSLERLLIDRDLISYGPAGRELTAEGAARARGGYTPDPPARSYRSRAA